MNEHMKSVDEYPAIMTVAEAAKFLQIGRNTAYALVGSGSIPSVKIGRQIRIYREDIISSVFKAGSGIEK